MTCGHHGAEPRGWLPDVRRRRGNTRWIVLRYLDEGWEKLVSTEGEKSVEAEHTCTDDEEVEGERSLALGHGTQSGLGRGKERH